MSILSAEKVLELTPLDLIPVLSLPIVASLNWILDPSFTDCVPLPASVSSSEKWE